MNNGYVESCLLKVNITINFCILCIYCDVNNQLQDITLVQARYD